MSSNESKKNASARPSINALAGLVPPKIDLVGPTVGDDIRRAIQRYGAEAVKAAVKEATKAKRGRPLEKDWLELRELILAEAREWLDGGDPFSARTNYAIAKEFAERNPGHSVIATHKRIERKLSRGPYNRRWWTLVNAEVISRDSYPFAAHLRALEALAKLHDGTRVEIWQWSLDRARSTIADYEAREGTPPEKTMSYTEIEQSVQRGGMAALLNPPKSGGLSGFASTSSPQHQRNVHGSVLARAVHGRKD